MFYHNWYRGNGCFTITGIEAMSVCHHTCMLVGALPYMVIHVETHSILSKLVTQAFCHNCLCTKQTVFYYN